MSLDDADLLSKLRQVEGLKYQLFRLGNVIYGHHGLNRYLIREDGKIVFSRYHAASLEAIQKAESVGFEVV